MKINELVFIRDKQDLMISLSKVRNKKNTMFVCLTFEAFLETKMNLLNYTFPFKIKKIHNYDFLNLGKKQARLFISNNLKNYSKDDMNYLISRFIIFFSQIIFDKTLIISLIKLYNPEKVLIFEEKIHSIIIKGWNINRGFFYYQSIIKIFFPKIKIDFYKIKNQKYKNFVLKIYNILNTNNVVKNLINSLNIIINKNLIILEGLRGDKLLKKKITKNFKQRNYTIITEFKNSIFIRLLYYFYKKKKLYNIRNNQNKKKIFGLGYLNLKIEIDSMTTFMSNYFKYQKFLINKFKKKKILFGLFQEKSDINIALKKSNIKTFQLPHGAIVTPELSPMVASYNFISNLNQKIYYQRSKMLTGKSYVSGVPHINSNINNVRKSFKKIIIFMKNMGMRRWEFDDYDKILEIISFISKYAKKK